METNQTTPMLSIRLTPETNVRLSKGEVAVLRLIAEGHPNQGVAEQLEISKRMVDYHLTKAYAKLNVGNRMLAIRQAWRLGLLPFEPNSNSSTYSEAGEGSLQTQRG